MIERRSTVQERRLSELKPVRYLIEQAAIAADKAALSLPASERRNRVCDAQMFLNRAIEMLTFALSDNPEAGSEDPQPEIKGE